MNEEMNNHQYVLVVDDDEHVLFVLRRALRILENGYRIEIARSGEEALQKAQKRPYHILITDILMPGMNGVELTRAIKELYPATTVIWITAHGRERFQSDEEQLSVYECLEKPIRIDAIRQAVLRVAESPGI